VCKLSVTVKVVKCSRMPRTGSVTLVGEGGGKYLTRVPWNIDEI
jgi:hypothetical protein